MRNCRATVSHHTIENQSAPSVKSKVSNCLTPPSATADSDGNFSFFVSLKLIFKKYKNTTQNSKLKIEKLSRIAMISATRFRFTFFLFRFHRVVSLASIRRRGTRHQTHIFHLCFVMARLIIAIAFDRLCFLRRLEHTTHSRLSSN